jgi:hypothetical protein
MIESPLPTDRSVLTGVAYSITNAVFNNNVPGFYGHIEASTASTSKSGLANGDGAREVKTKRPGDEAAPEQRGDGTNVQLHTHEREERRDWRRWR